MGDVESSSPSQVPGSQIACVVCHRPIIDRVHLLGGRPYCGEHYARATMGSRGTWPSIAVMVIGLVALAMIMLAVGPRISEELGKNALILLGLILAVVPAALWLGVFYQLDHLEPEPHSFLISVMVLGALFAGTIGEPLRRGLLELHQWQPENWFYSIVVHTLTQGVIQALIVYITVRSTVYLTDEFDERADGIIYGTAAGLGIATLLNFNYVLDHRGLNLDVGTARIIINGLTLAALGGVVGYGLGQVKFEQHAPWFAALWVGLSALLNGCFDWLLSEVTARELSFEAWPGTIVAGLFAVVVFGIAFFLLRRAVNETLALAGAPAVAASGEQ